MAPLDQARRPGLQVCDHDVNEEESREKGPVFFRDKTDLDILAAQQGVSAVSDFDSLLGDFWPDEECADQHSDGDRRGMIPVQA